MIKHLFIRNFVLIDELNLEFSEGFSAFVGETGAGKSIVIDAISLLRGDHASNSLIAKGAEKAIVEGTFDLSRNRHALSVLEEAGFETEGEVTFTRELLSSGKSTARIDHRIVTLALLKEVLQDEIDIHGQRDSAYLLNANTHIRLLDEFLQDSELLSAVSHKYGVWKQLCNERDEALKNTYSENDLEYFQYEVSEIEAADLKPGEDEELERKEQEFKAVKGSFEKLGNAVSLYEDSISQPLYELNRLISSVEDTPLLNEARQEITDSYYALSDAAQQIQKVLDSMSFSEEEINEMEERLYLIQKMKRKYGRTIEDIYEKKAELERQIEMIANRNEYLAQMDKKISAAFEAYRKDAALLSIRRREGYAAMDTAVMKNLKDLVLPNARFRTSISDCSPTENGIDKVEFLISMNRGEDLKPLNKTASGGEISRLMLGLKEVFSRLQGIETVIFDEIDTGVSGPVAEAIGHKMREISEDAQVFSVTHLAPVAACCRSFYLVSKSEKDGRTHTYVNKLDHDAMIDQLALIASGQITGNSRAAAEELYKRNQ